MKAVLGVFLAATLVGQVEPAAKTDAPAASVPPSPVLRVLAADAHERRQQRIVLASAEEAKQLGLSPKDIYLVRTKGGDAPRPLQWDDRTKEPYFVLPSQPANQAVEVAIESVESHQHETSVEHAYVDDQLWMTSIERGVPRRLFAFQHEELLPPGIKPVYRRAGFIHPVLTPAGDAISGSFAPDHAHHHGIWTAWSHTEFQGRHPDFWNVQEQTGRVDYVGLGARWIGLVDSGFTAEMRSQDVQAQPPVDVLTEQWRVTTYHPVAGTALNVFELETTQRNVTKDPLVLTKHIYGGLGFRGLETWVATAPLTFLTSEGQVGRKAGDGQRVRWFAFAGPTAKGRGGIAILAHPDNVNFPQWTRFNPKDPFVAFTPVHDGALTLAPDQILKQRFRFVTFDGEPDVALLEALWQGYAHPAKATAK